MEGKGGGVQVPVVVVVVVEKQVGAIQRRPDSEGVE